MAYLSSIAKLALGAAVFSTAVSATGSETCTNPKLSCHTTPIPTNTCCYVTPGGQLLQTQFWDTDPVTGPTTSWTIHGLWPDECNGSYQEDCDSTRAYTNITAILKSYGATTLLNYMDTYWISNDESNEAFWDHEWETHGTCISTFATSCYPNYKPGMEIPDFFNATVNLFKTLPTYQWLSAAGITPSNSKTYTSAAILSALSSPRGGVTPTISCSGSSLDEVYYYFNMMGSVQTGTFVPTNPVGSSSSCPSTGIKYTPKTALSPSPSPSPSPTPSSSSSSPEKKKEMSE
ncbi:MAG: ribonuclease T2-like [Icmadophila ericetorum]|nr:ribonuclease T2-like [Icmadophila ericetorum]